MMPNWIRFSAPLVAALALTACNTTRNVAFRATAPVLPAPLFEPLPIAVAVWYAPELGDHRAIGTKSTTRPGGAQVITHYDIQCGDVHLTVLQGMINAAFAKVSVLAAEPSGPVAEPAVDLLVLPQIERIAYGTGADVRYRISLVRPDGEQLTNVLVTGTASETVPEERWLEVATRDAAAQILVRLTRSEKLGEWLEERRQAGTSRAGASS